jgi:hypothetical protein
MTEALFNALRCVPPVMGSREAAARITPRGVC